MVKQNKFINLSLLAVIFYQVFLTSMWQETYTSKIWKLLGYLLYGLLLLSLLYQLKMCHSELRKTTMFYLLFCAIFFSIYMYKGYLDIAVTFLICAAVIFLSINDLLKNYFFGISGGMILVFLCAAVTMIPNYNKRWIFSFGFKNPNTFGFYLILLYFLFLYLINKKMKISATVAFVILTLFLKFELDDVTATIALFIGFICYILLPFGKKILKFNMVKWFINFLPILFTFLTYWIGINYFNYGWMYELNNVFTSRPIIWNYYLNNYSFHLTGTDIPKDISVSRGAFDGAYLYYPMLKGIVPFIFILALAVIALEKINKNNLYFLTVILVLLLFFAFSENTSFIVYQSPFIPLVTLVVMSINPNLLKEEKFLREELE